MAMEKTFNAKAAEARIFEAWETSGAFKAGANKREGAESFCIMIPPPNVTGALHIGHAFNNTLQDILVRWHRMRGFDTLWQPGQDHAGIATQLQVEKMLAANGEPSRAEMGREAFIEKVWEWKEKYGSTIVNQLKRLGASCDWDRNAFTMDEVFHNAVLKVFVDLYNKGLIYRGKRLVNWDPHFETAISDLEVENIEIDGNMWHFKYPLAGGATYEYVEKDEDGNVTLSETRDYISIATTRPETMLGDGAVAVHPDDERYAPIVGMLCEIPVGPKEHRRLIPIITDEYPDMNFGSGAVKITGAHDANDYGVAKRNNIPLYRLMDTKAQMRSDGANYETAAKRAKEISEGGDWDEAEIDSLNLVPDEYRNNANGDPMDRFEARKKVVADIDAEGLMIMVEDKKIMQPFCDRSKVVMEPMLTDQWYVDAAKLAGPARDAVTDGRVKIMPESGEKVYFHWMNNIEPWCISRQLWWGHQIPVWYGPELTDTGELLYPATKHFCASNVDEAIEQARQYYGEKWEINESEWSPEFFKGEGQQAGAIVGQGIHSSVLGANPKDGRNYINIARDPDVLDTWFSSGLWPIGTLGWPNWTEDTKKYFPTSTLITGQDILFFWVARMMMMQLEVVGEVPFDTVYLHQLVRDEKGVKMSKTLGNVIDPLDMIDEYGADAVRFTMSSMASIGGTLKLSTERVEGYRNFGTKLWNAVSFAQYNDCIPVADFDPAAVKLPLNKWMIGEAAKAFETYDAALKAYRFNDAASAAYVFVRGTLCDRYLEFTKPTFFSEDAAAIAETRATMAWIIDQSLILLHPMMPFITEELWGIIAKRDNMLVHQDWPEYGTELVDKDADREMDWVISLVDSIRSARAEVNVPAGAKIPMLQQQLDDKGRVAWANNEALIKRLARIETLSEVADLPQGAVTIAVEGGVFALPLADIIDVSAEKERLSKTIGKLEKELGGLRGRLNNPKFVESAPEAVVAESRENLAVKEAEADKLKAALARLAEMG